MKNLGMFRGKILVVLLISLSIVIADQVSKYLFNCYLYPGQSIPVIRNIFHFTLVYNTGIAFGLFKNQGALFIALSVVAIILIIVNIFREARGKCYDFTSWVGLSLILGGAGGNLIDRLRFGFVVDFLDFRIWPVFNLADSAITIGAVLILLRCIQSSVK